MTQAPERPGPLHTPTGLLFPAVLIASRGLGVHIYIYVYVFIYMYIYVYIHR